MEWTVVEGCHLYTCGTNNNTKYRLCYLSGETESVYANAIKQPGNPGLVRVKVVKVRV